MGFAMEEAWLGYSYREWLRGYASVVLDLQRKRVPSLEVEPVVVFLRAGELTEVWYEAVNLATPDVGPVLWPSVADVKGCSSGQS